MNKQLLTILGISLLVTAKAQDANVTSWLQNTTVYGSHYVSGNSTLIQDADLVNVQSVDYTANFVFVSTEGVPAYPTGPFLDGNPSLATAQNQIYRIPFSPVQNTTGNLSTTTGGNIGIFINGISLFDYRDGVSYSLSAGQDQGGPGGGMGDGVWNRDAIPAERDGFDCSKGHPANGNYHHHQNPSAFKLDINVTSTICNLYDADGLYVMDSTVHSPLIGFAYDGFPIYGAYGYTNSDGTGGVSRIKSSYNLRNISVRTHYADGSDVTDGPNVSAAYPLGNYREDYEYISSTDENKLDEHNGRICVTPDYPDGIYAYFATVNSDLTSAYPYAIGPTYYGVKNGGTATNVPGIAVNYTTPINTGIVDDLFTAGNFTVFPNPSSEFIAVQSTELVTTPITLKLYSLEGKLVRESVINQGSTLYYLDVKTLYAGQYVLEVSKGGKSFTKSISIIR